MFRKLKNSIRQEERGRSVTSSLELLLSALKKNFNASEENIENSGTESAKGKTMP